MLQTFALAMAADLTGSSAMKTQTVTSVVDVVSRQPGIVKVPDIFAIVVGPGMLVVDGDVTFDDSFNVPSVEAAIVEVAAALRAAWPSIVYVYLNPVAAHRERRGGQGGIAA